MKKKPKLKELTTIPNILSLSRVLFGIIAFILIIKSYYIPAFILYILAASTDAFDGYFARKLKQTSEFGSFLDALCDRIFILLVFLGLLVSGKLDHPVLKSIKWELLIPIWIIIELIIAFLVSKKIKKSYLYSIHRNSIRHAAIFLYITVGALILNFKYPNVQILIISLNLLIGITLFMLIYALVDYIIYFKKLKRKK